VADSTIARIKRILTEELIGDEPMTMGDVILINRIAGKLVKDPGIRVTEEIIFDRMLHAESCPACHTIQPVLVPRPVNGILKVCDE
jgi:hypothetical protein